MLIKTMQSTAKRLCENIMGCKMAFVFSDEISLLLIDYERLNSESYFNYEVQKMCSVIASAATMSFNKYFEDIVTDLVLISDTDQNDLNNIEFAKEFGFDVETKDGREELKKYVDRYYKAMLEGATFDCRVFNVQSMDVTNYFYWRQLDATRNSIQMVGQANFSHKELQNKSCNEIQDMLHEQKGINWNDIPTHQKRGSCCIKVNELKEGSAKKLGDGSEVYYEGDTIRRKWIIDNEIPIFVNEGRNYIEKLI